MFEARSNPLEAPSTETRRRRRKQKLMQENKDSKGHPSARGNASSGRSNRGNSNIFTDKFNELKRKI